jgi:CheY-like chemotaxis protein
MSYLKKVNENSPCKILLIEDMEKNIQSAKEQFGNNEIIVARNLFEIHRYCYGYFEEDGIDLVLTDLKLPLGKGSDYGKCYDICKKFNPKDEFNLGLAVLLSTIKNHIPCLMVSDSNGHDSVLGLLLEDVKVFKSDNDIVYEKNRKNNLFHLTMRPYWINNDKNMKIKDWEKCLRRSSISYLFEYVE